MVNRTRVRTTTDVVQRQEGPYRVKPTKGWVSTPTALSSSIVLPDVMTDVVTPGFKAKSRRGEVINSPMTKTVSQATLIDAQLTLWTPSTDTSITGYRNTGWGSGLITGHETLISQGMAQSARLITQAVTEAYSKVNLPDVDALVTLAEMRETLSFLASPFKKATQLTERYRSYLAAYRRAEEGFLRRLALYEKRLASRKGVSYPKPVFNAPKFRVGRFEASDVSSAWLAYRYGIMPLIYEIQDYLEAYNNAAEKPQRSTARGKAVSSWSTHTENAYHWLYGLREDVTTNTDFKITVRAGVLFAPKVTTGTVGSQSDKYGLALHRVPIAVWEVVTLSMVADWFLNVGDYLNAMTATCRADILTAWYTLRLDVSHKASVKVGAADAYEQVGGDPLFTRQVTHTVRNPASITDVGLVRRVEMNAKRYADAAALIHKMLISTLKR